MVITPQQAKALTTVDKDIMKNLEKKIDEALLNGRTAVDFDEYPGEKVIDAITQIYSRAGWHVTYESDQRDGDYLQFEAWTARGRD
jgi:hypothetical protein